MAMGQRHNGEGTVYKRPDGTWAAQLSYVDPITGQRQTPELLWAYQGGGHEQAQGGPSYRCRSPRQSSALSRSSYCTTGRAHPGVLLAACGEAWHAIPPCFPSLYRW